MKKEQESNNRLLSEEVKSIDDVIEILGKVVNDIQLIDDITDNLMLTNISDNEQLDASNDLSKANDILSAVLANIEASKDQLPEAKSRLLRLLIRETLALEQVVGFNIGSAPAAAKYGSGTLSSSSSDDDLLSLGTTSGESEVPVGDDSDEEQGATDSELQTLTKQRQKQLNKNNAVDATSTGRQLSALKSRTG